MKGFFAFILDALRDVDVTKLAKPLYILATADEETSMAGARYFAETTALRPDCAIIGEPTSLQPVRHGGDASNRICACCELHMDIRPLPGMTLNELNGLLNDALAPVSERWPGRLTVDELHPPIPGYECPPNHQLVEVVEKLLGAKTEVVNYCTEAPFIQTLCPTLVLGPGSINQAHQPDEYLETRFIKPTRELITQVIHHFCWH